MSYAVMFGQVLGSNGVRPEYATKLDAGARLWYCAVSDALIRTYLEHSAATHLAQTRRRCTSWSTRTSWERRSMKSCTSSITVPIGLVSRCAGCCHSSASRLNMLLD